MKICPFCGSSNVNARSENACYGHGDYTAKIKFYCKGCGLDATFTNLSGSYNEYNISRAIEKWNTRAGEEGGIVKKITHERAIELLNSIIDHVAAGENLSGQLEELIRMGFTHDDLLCFGYNKYDLDQYEEGINHA